MIKNKKADSILIAFIVVALTIFLIYILDQYAPKFASLIAFSSLFTLLMRTFIIFMFAFIMFRLLGKRQLSQLTFIDLLIIIALGSAVGDVMIYSEDIAHLINSVITVGFITILVMIIDRIIAKNISVGRFIEGRSTILVKHGKIINENLDKENMNKDELLEELHEKNIYKISDIEEVVLEPNGGLSIKHKKRKFRSSLSNNIK